MTCCLTETVPTERTCQMSQKTITRPAWQDPTSENEILAKIKEFDDANIHYFESKELGFPGTPPLPICQQVYSDYVGAHANNIGMHTNPRPDTSEYGFEGSQQAEREVIGMCADLMDASPDEVGGYISPGGTEANIVGCWIGRNRSKGRTAIVGSFLTHYSIVKAADLLGIGAKPQSDGSGLHLVGTDSNGHINLEHLWRVLLDLARLGLRHFIVIGNAGTTMLGSVDDIPGMCEVISRLEHEYPTAVVHLHVDAAFGGFVIPFLEKYKSRRIGFSNPRVDSVTVDLHKMGQTPYGSGVIMARREQFKNVFTLAPYVRGGDSTLCGSRGGVIAFSCWAAMKFLGRTGYEKEALERVRDANTTRQMLTEAGLSVFENDTNIVAVRGEFPLSKKLMDKVFITHAQEDFPADMSNPAGREFQTVWKVVVMPHMDIDTTIKAFLDARNA